ncbi:hypothetical protein B0H66DRAFT_539293 [Apodospora peruviana]|uniref:Uncharacterized protein n=1 Tax=Apodospora peruviana TaxID=516989 RepID=A0AAE0IP29_9PEZI|nr:hypothetical protein B0H66DRAFT_539293 [Apodospora peruviana]
MSGLSPTAILRHGLRVLLPLSLVLTVYLYLYPVFNTCAFPLPPGQHQHHQSRHDAAADKGRAAYLETARLHWPFDQTPAAAAAVTPPEARPPLAPFRLLALGDPQLEGDTSIPTNYLGVFPHASSLVDHLTFRSSHASLRQRVRQSLHDLVDILFDDLYYWLESARKRLDHFGNDFYLAHQYRAVRWWTRPTHVAVLGDLVGSQWLDDAEFFRRAHRYWSRVFRGGERVPDEVAAYPADEYELAGYLGRTDNDDVWTRRIINVAGNHDIGYAGDITTNRTERFERAFGKINYELRFELPLLNDTTTSAKDADADTDRLTPELRVVVLNDMNLDTPAASSELQDATYNFVNSVINTATAVEFKGHFTVILTHVPLYKPEGVCVDDPLFDFHEHDGTLKEQNQLSAAASKGFLEGMLGMSGDVNAPARGRGRPGVILNGHDHEGCDTWHYINQSAPADGKEWEVKRWRQALRAGVVGQDDVPGVREITVRSMMGGFGGNAGLLSVWFDEATWEWKVDYATCPLGTQHLWWFVHFLDLGVLVGIMLALIVGVLGAVGVDVDKLLVRQRSVATKSTPAGKGDSSAQTEVSRQIQDEMRKGTA